MNGAESGGEPSKDKVFGQVYLMAKCLRKRLVLIPLASFVVSAWEDKKGKEKKELELVASAVGC